MTYARMCLVMFTLYIQIMLYIYILSLFLSHTYTNTHKSKQVKNRYFPIFQSSHKIISELSPVCHGISEQWRFFLACPVNEFFFAFAFYLYFSVLLNKTHVTDDSTIIKNKLFIFPPFFLALY